MGRWRPFQGSRALAPVTAVPEASVGLLGVDTGWDTPEARRAHWGVLAMDLLRDTEVPTRTVLDAYLDRVLSA